MSETTHSSQRDTSGDGIRSEVLTLASEDRSVGTIEELRDLMAQAWDRGHFYCAADQGDARCKNPYVPETCWCESSPLELGGNLPGRECPIHSEDS